MIGNKDKLTRNDEKRWQLNKKLRKQECEEKEVKEDEEKRRKTKKKGRIRRENGRY